MSLILDALRKSESERRRGQVPDLRAELPPIVRATIAPRRRWPLWFAAGAVLLAIAVLGWSLWASRSPPPPATVVAAPETSPAPPPSDPLPTTPRPSEMPRQAPPRKTASAPSSEAAQPVTDDVYAAASAAPPRDAAAPEPIAAPTPQPVTGPAPSTEERTVASAPTVPAPPAVAAASALPDTAATVRLSDLSAGEREQLPALKISMHMWGPTPAQRFAIIDGTRVGQGDRIGEAVVEEIAADGVVLNWHGRRVSLPLR